MAYLLSVLSYVSERPSCFVAKPTLHRNSVHFSLGFFTPEYPTFFAAHSKLRCISMQIFTFYLSGAPGSSWCWHLSSKWLLSFRNYVSEQLSCFVAKPTLHHRSLHFFMGFFTPEYPTFFAALSKLRCISMQIFTFYFLGASGSGWCSHLSSK